MFNPNSRWDRDLPSENENIGEFITVSAVFKKGKIFPQWFKWKGRKYNVEQITYYWKDKKGEENLHYFSVNDRIDTYQICLNDKYLNWKITKVCQS